MSYMLTPTQFRASTAKIASIKARAVKRGWTGDLDITGERRVITNTGSPLPYPDYPAGAQVVRVETTITGEPACYEGWRLLAALDFAPAEDGTGSWIVRCAPGLDDAVIDRAGLRAGACDHCETDRPNRRHLYAVQHLETGRLVQIGATCLRDFLGHNLNPVFISAGDLRAEEWAAGSGPESWTPQWVVQVALAAVEVDGWTSRHAAGAERHATADLVEAYLNERGKTGAETRRLIDPAMPAAASLAPAVIEAVLAEVGSAREGYPANLAAALRAEQAGEREIGLLASTVACWRRLVADSALGEAAGPADGQPEPVWLGRIGDKVEISGVVRTAMSVDGFAYNSTQRLLILRAGDTLAKIYTAARWSYDVSSGDTLRLTATVKAHDVYRGEQQTVLTRARQVPQEPDKSLTQ